jgi:hypothetical protein
MQGMYHACKVNAVQIDFGDGFVNKGHSDVPGNGGCGIVPRAGVPWTPANRKITRAQSTVIKQLQSNDKKLGQIS